MGTCRIDKFVWCVRLAKTRSIASQMISKGKVRLNDKEVKASKDVKIGDEVTIIRHTAKFRYKILNLLDRRIGAKLVDEYIKDITPEEEKQKYKLFREAQKTYRVHGSGKPTKKDRRVISDFLNRVQEERE